VWFRESIGLHEAQASELLSGVMPITPLLARGLAQSVGSTADFWLERQKQYQLSLKALAAAEPQLEEWAVSFPLKSMVASGWLAKPRSKADIPYELLDYFDVESVDEWRANYLKRLGMTQFRTSGSFQDDTSSTAAWIRYGELKAEAIQCKSWDQQGFRTSLTGLKQLTSEPNPRTFIPHLIAECAKHGVAVVVERCVTGCVASGATCMLNANKALLMLSGRFLSDDQFWFSFFHEAGHLILHGSKPHVDALNFSTGQKEKEANEFAEAILIGPEQLSTLQSMPINKFSIVRLARRCNVSPGIIVGQLQYRNRISRKLFNKFKTRYKVDSFIP
jgi:Zn-dependent peptidase ImmA (M78 family)/plasmid maintenance system antidote protein VapI